MVLWSGRWLHHLEFATPECSAGMVTMCHSPRDMQHAHACVTGKCADNCRLAAALLSGIITAAAAFAVNFGEWLLGELQGESSYAYLPCSSGSMQRLLLMCDQLDISSLVDSKELRGLLHWHVHRDWVPGLGTSAGRSAKSRVIIKGCPQ